MDIVKIGCTGSCHPLADTIPVVQKLDARPVGRNDHRHPVIVRASGTDHDQIRIEAAGAVVFRAAKTEVVALAAQPRLEWERAAGLWPV